MSLCRNFGLRNKNFVTDGAVLAFCFAGYCAGRLDCRIGYFGVTICGNIHGIRRIAAVALAGAALLTILGAGCFGSDCPVAKVMAECIDCSGVLVIANAAGSGFFSCFGAGWRFGLFVFAVVVLACWFYVIAFGAGCRSLTIVCRKAVRRAVFDILAAGAFAPMRRFVIFRLVIVVNKLTVLCTADLAPCLGRAGSRAASVFSVHRHSDGFALAFCIRGGNRVFARQKDILVIFIWHQLFAIFRHGHSTSHREVDLTTISFAVFNANKYDLRR